MLKNATEIHVRPHPHGYGVQVLHPGSPTPPGPVHLYAAIDDAMEAAERFQRRRFMTDKNASVRIVVDPMLGGEG